MSRNAHWPLVCVCNPLSGDRTKRGRDTSPGLVLGYGTMTPAKIEQGVRLLAEATAGARRE